MTTKKLPFNVGDNICWLYGNHYRIGTVSIIEEKRIFVHGMNSSYWVSLKMLLPRLDLVPRSDGNVAGQ